MPTRGELVRRAGYEGGRWGLGVLDPGERVLDNDGRLLHAEQGGKGHWRQVWREQAVVRRMVGTRCEGHVLMACWVVEGGVGRRMVWGCRVCGGGRDRGG